MIDLLRRPQIQYADLEPISPASRSVLSPFPDLREEVVEQVEVAAKYEGYLDKEKETAAKLTRLEDVPLDLDIDYGRLTSLSMEARQKLEQVRPSTLGQAYRISGITPADLSVLMVYLGR